MDIAGLNDGENSGIVPFMACSADLWYDLD